MRRHVPDFLLLDRDGACAWSTSNPPISWLTRRWPEALAWAGEVFAGRGWRHEIWSGADPVLLANVRFLAGYRIRAGWTRRWSAVGSGARDRVSDREMEQAWPRPRLARRARPCCTWSGGACCARTCRCRCRPRRAGACGMSRAAGGDGDHDRDPARL